MKFRLTILLIVCSITVFGQLNTEEELTLNQEDGMIHTGVYPIGKQGVLVFSKGIKGKNALLTAYSCGLKKQAAHSFEMSDYDRSLFLGVFPDEDSATFSCLGSVPASWIVLTFDPEKQTFEQKLFPKKKISFVPSFSIRMKNRIVMHGLIKSVPHVVTLDLVTGQQEYVRIPLLKWNNGGEILSVSPDLKNQRLAIVFRTQSTMKNSRTLALTFMEPDGRFSHTSLLQMEKDPLIIDGRVTWLSDSNFVFSGTYSDSWSRKLVEGFFFSKWENFTQQSLTYHLFNQFGHYNEYISADRKRSLKIDELSWLFPDDAENNVILYSAFVSDSGYRIVGELYYPEYSYYKKDKTNVWGTKIGEEEVKVFNGFVFTHTAILDLDSNGNKVRDYCFPLMRGRMPQQVESQIRILRGQDQQMQFLVPRRDGLFTYEIIGDQLRSSELKSIGMLSDEDQNGKMNLDFRFLYWYDDHYLVYGMKPLILKEEKIESLTKIGQSVFLLKAFGKQ